ncbi:alpha/beta hydrolase [Candidatus Daviesbacteria bacterium]|nr:alpha/beta hydrolase [Candidatus Daviesbacteria bacterium]
MVTTVEGDPKPASAAVREPVGKGWFSIRETMSVPADSIPVLLVHDKSPDASTMLLGELQRAGRMAIAVCPRTPGLTQQPRFTGAIISEVINITGLKPSVDVIAHGQQAGLAVVEAALKHPDYFRGVVFMGTKVDTLNGAIERGRHRLDSAMVLEPRQNTIFGDSRQILRALDDLDFLVEIRGRMIQSTP